MTYKNLNNFFHPKSVVIFGLSPSQTNLCRNILANCRRWNFSGRIYGISPQEGVNDGVNIYTSLDRLPEKPELALIFTKAPLVPEILLDCASNGIKKVAVSSAGFEETGKSESIELSRRVKDICIEKGIDMVGPNGIATACTKSGLALSFMPLAKPPSGKVAFVTQSGGVGTTTLERMSMDAVELGKFVSMGNKTILDEADYLEYFAADPETDIICMHLEDLRRGREFLAAAKKCRKPLIVYMANVSPYGTEAASSHTAALRNDEQLIDCAFRQAGIIRAKSLLEMMHTVKSFSMPVMKGNRLLVLSPSGGLAVILSDLAWKYGFELPALPADLVEQYSSKRRAGVIEFRNPLDFGDVYSAETQRNFLRDIMRREDFDGLIMAYLYRDPDILKHYATLNQLQRDLISEFKETIEQIGKPVGFVLSVPHRHKENVFARTRYPIFEDPEDAFVCLSVLRDYSKRQETGG